MKRSILSWLAIASTVSLVITLVLLSLTSNISAGSKSQSKDDFRPPLQIAGNHTSSSHHIRNPLAEGDLLRRNLSEFAPNTTQEQLQTDSQQAQQPQQQTEVKKEDPNANKDERPSGVVYQYIPPPPINFTARSLLHSQFRHLANISDPSENSAVPPPVTASLCGIVKDSEPYLDEWIDYHFGLGFHTIYLVDNSDNHELLTWQNKRRNAGYSVRVIPKPGHHRQMYGYHMCVAEFKQDHTYMAFFDVDEFLVLKKHETVNELLAEHLPKGALQISWYVFGTSEKSLYAPLPVTKRFLYRDGDENGKNDRHEVWYNVKSILKLSDYGGYPKSPHSMKTNKRKAGSDKAWIDTNGGGNFDSIGSANYDRPVDVAVLHHYKYLSEKEFLWKSCVRKTVDDQFKDCNEKLQKLSKRPYVGKFFDDSAWQTLKKNVPKYAMYDEFEDFM